MQFADPQFASSMRSALEQPEAAFNVDNGRDFDQEYEDQLDGDFGEPLMPAPEATQVDYEEFASDDYLTKKEELASQFTTLASMTKEITKTWKEKAELEEIADETKPHELLAEVCAPVRLCPVCD